MKIKRYEASSIQEAIVKIKNDLGEQAILLSSKRLRGGRTPLFELTAAADEGQAEGRPSAVPRPEPRATERTPLVPQESQETLQAFRRDLEDLKALVIEANRKNILYGELMELKESLNSFFDMLGVRKAEGKPQPLSKLYCNLVAGGVSKDRAYRLVGLIRKGLTAQAEEDFDGVLHSAEEFIQKSLVPSYERTRQGRVVAFVGPTGVGKTTTLAKLAARWALEEDKKVGLVTADTYRIAAIEQLRTYAKIMGLPLEVASEKEEFKNALHRFRDRDVILIDTPGRSFTDERHLDRLRDYLRLEIPVETNLLISMTASPENMLATTSRFDKVGYEAIIFTKLDESNAYGQIYNIIDQVGKPVYYVTNGQNVPHDIERLNPAKLAKMIVRNSLH
ncbi:MAG TPA: flagellar biosynthesis protein FlhF [Syntrophales bacterium]|nr:flagellar biosynthesis protein FlhF [Syntrophales bacterium]HOX93428.1 flagellar biosynthesis protein FlhF [Syntrophales bacterium]HPI56647.1 flagellar biosynthesis protein FlhF [Syntrophales bacterium]HPN24927.1 flagellar biosynthesis protein FlhF [Syntrophales bacterium]HQM29736.1 flagellar biosynthesis protein FlhF [Syntrophales bacterium]